MRKEWIVRVAGVIIASGILVGIVETASRSLGKHLQERLLSDPEIQNVVALVQESGVEPNKVRMALQTTASYPGFFVFMILCVVITLGVYKFSYKLAAKALGSDKSPTEAPP